MQNNPVFTKLRLSLLDEPKPEFKTLEELIDWYFSNGTPMLIPYDAEIFQTDDATAISLYRDGQYQVELYLLHAPYSIPMHAHPGIELTQVYLLAGEDPKPLGDRNNASLVHQDWGLTIPKLPPGEYHGTEGMPLRKTRGQVMLVFERWPEGVRPTTVAAVWKGRSVGPKHDELIRRYEQSK